MGGVRRRLDPLRIVLGGAVLLGLIVTINAWNALSRAWEPGSYQP